MKRVAIGLFVAGIFFAAGILSKKKSAENIVTIDKIESKTYLDGNVADSAQNNPTEKSQNILKLESLAGKNQISKKIVEIMHINSLEEENAEYTPIREQAVKELQARPRETIRSIEQLLNALPKDGFEMERLRLLVLSSFLEGVTAERKEIAYKEMTSQIPEKRPDPNNAQTEEELNQALSTTFEMAVPMVAHGILLGTITDKDEAYSKTVEGVVAQQEPYIQRGIINQYLQVYPDDKQRINEELASRNINPFQSYDDQEEKVETPADDSPVEFVKEN